MEALFVLALLLVMLGVAAIPYARWTLSRADALARPISGGVVEARDEGAAVGAKRTTGFDAVRADLWRWDVGGASGLG